MTKLFHCGRFDIAMLSRAFGVNVTPVYCTKIASKLARTCTERHGRPDRVVIDGSQTNRETIV